MKINDIFNVLNNYAPLELSTNYVKTYNAYDNSGILVDVDEEIKGILFTLDLTKKSVELAIEKGCNLIITHHPAIYKPISSIKNSSSILKATNNKIGVISFHLNLDMAKFGIDYYLACGLGGKEHKILMPLSQTEGYGRSFVANKTLKEIVEKYKSEFNSQNVIVYGDLNKKVNKMATFCGAGLEEEYVEEFNDCDLFLSSDVPHHVILKIVQEGKMLIVATHYSSEFYGFNKFYENVKTQFKDIPSFINVEKEYL